MLIRLAVVLTIAASPAAAQDWLQAADREDGRDLYLYFCAECHGKDAASQGPMAEMLALSPPALTQLAMRNYGRFPTEAVARKIDGRRPDAAHGDMPLFGPSLEEDQLVALALPSGQPMMVTRSLGNLLAYLQSLQDQGAGTD